MDVLRRRLLTLTTLVAVAVVAAPAGAATPDRAATAHAAGGDVPPAIPAVVRTRVKRVEAALDRLGGNVDDGDAAAATRTGTVVRQQLQAAWRGAKYYIKHAPPPVADDARTPPSRPRARASGDGPAAPVAADPPTVALAVFQLQDDAVSEVIGLFDGAAAPLVSPLNATLTAALDRRDAAVKDVHALAPAPAADDARAAPRAHAAGGEVVNTFATVMPQVSPMLDDEVMQIDSLRSESDGLPAGAKPVLKAAKARIVATELRINTYWPPVAADD
jgi:hypothetical protein